MGNILRTYHINNRETA